MSDNRRIEMMAYITKTKSRSFEAQIRLKGLRPISKTFKTKTLAKQFVREVEGDFQLQHALGRPIVNKIKFNDFVELYLNQYTGKDPSTTGRLKWWCEQFGNIDVTEVTSFMVDDGLIKLSKTLSGSTVNRYKSTLSSVFIYFIRHPEYKKVGLKNPVKAELVSTYAENPAKERFLTLGEQSSLLNTCKESHYDRLYLLVLLALTTGARKGELLGLKWCDINFKTRLATLHTTKNGKPRLLPLTSTAIKELMKFREVGT